jgi:LacI family transcriptional regulator
MRNPSGLQDRHVLSVLLPFSTHYAREVLLGIAAYRPTRVRWRIDFGDESARDYLLSRPDTVMITILSSTAVQERAHPQARVVNVAPNLPALLRPHVTADNVAAGRLAAEHLLDLTHTRFACMCRMHTNPQEFRQGFMERLQAAGHTATDLSVVDGTPGGHIETIRSSPRPIAILVEDDKRGTGLVQNCVSLGLGVPSEVAIVGYGNDPLYCEVQHPFLTSIDPAARQIGFEAARLMERILTEPPMPPCRIRVPPAGLVPRETTSKRATDDRIIQRALQYIQEHATHGITIESVARAVGVNRRTLRNRYREHFKESVRTEIRRVQIERAKELLITTDTQIVDIPASCGFAHYGRFSSLFTRTVGVTPAEYRRRHRVR